MRVLLVEFTYGATWDRSPLHGLGIVDDTRCYQGKEYWHIQPIWWEQGSPLPRWVEAESVPVLNPCPDLLASKGGQGETPAASAAKAS